MNDMMNKCQVLISQPVISDTTCICFAADGLFNDAEIGVMCFTVLQEEPIPPDRQSFSSPTQGQQRYRHCSSTTSRQSSGTTRVDLPVNTSPCLCYLANFFFLWPEASSHLQATFRTIQPFQEVTIQDDYPFKKFLSFNPRDLTFL